MCGWFGGGLEGGLWCYLEGGAERACVRACLWVDALWIGIGIGYDRMRDDLGMKVLSILVVSWEGLRSVVRGS